MSATQLTPIPLEWIVKTFGVGNLHFHNRGTWRWYIGHRKKIIWLIDGMYPHLKFKGPQALLLKELCERPITKSRMKEVAQLLSEGKFRSK